MAKSISLTQGLVTLVDDGDYEWLNQWKWYAYQAGNTWYARRSSGKPIQKTILMHRLIARTPLGMETDHRDGNGLNNTRANLRTCTKAENQRNRKLQLINSSGFKGVTWDKHNQKWHAQISVFGKKSHLGFFVSVEEAARAYDRAAREKYGPFARLNFQDGES